ncbi:MAG: DUF5652 family protein [Candidatus Pacearchaeota archaeon]
MALDYNQISSLFGINPTLLIILLIWSLTWKGIALWKASQNKDVIWFIIILIINTFGILEILYIFLFSEIFYTKKKIKKKQRKRR